MNREMREEIEREITGEDPLSMQLKKFVPDMNNAEEYEECLKIIKKLCKRCNLLGHVAADCQNEAEEDRTKVVKMCKLIQLFKRRKALDDEDTLRAQVASKNK